VPGNYRRIYPKDGRVLLDGGKNSKFERSLILDNESPDCANVVFSNGAVGTREGFGKANSTAVGSYVCDGLYTRRARDLTETMVAWFGGNFYTYGTATFVTVPSGQSVWTAGARVGAVTDENYLFMGNGGSIPYKWDGTVFSRHGVYPPTLDVLSGFTQPTFSAASAATGAALASGSSYTYKVTFRNTALVESDTGVAVTHVVAANSMGNVALTSLPIAPASFGINARVIYRTAAGGSTFKKIATIADNSTRAYDDAITDATQSTGSAAPTDNGVPPKYNACIYLAGRLFMNDPANPGLVWWTEAGNPYTVGALNFKLVGDNTSDLVKGFAVYDNSLIVFCEKSITIGYNSDEDPGSWQWVVSRSAMGSKSPYGAIKYNDKLLFPAMQDGKFVGFATFRGDTTETSATLLTVSAAGSELTSDRIEPDMFTVVESTVGNISSIVYKNRAFISLTYSSGSTNNRVYMFDFGVSNLSKKQEAAWVPWTGIQASQFTIYNGSLYFGSANASGMVYRLENGTYSDDGSAIDSYFWTKEFAGFPNETNYAKDFRFANILVDMPGSYFMNVSYRVDSDAGTGTTQQVTLNPGGSLWGTLVWGVDLWGGGSSQAEKELAISPARGKRIQFKFSNQNTAGQRFKVHGLNFTYNLKGFR
jgi:hypothetical protein